MRQLHPALRRLPVVLLVSVCVVNAGFALFRSYHTNFSEGSLPELARSVEGVRSSLMASHVEEIGYASAKGASPGPYFQLQSVMAPILLRRDSPDPELLLMNFESTHQVGTVPGFTVMHDLGNGLVLFRKN